MTSPRTAAMFGQPGPGQTSADTIGLAAVGRVPILHAPPPLGNGRTEPDPDGGDALAVSVRNQSIHRMEMLSRNHARLALETTGTPICAHAVAFLYLDTVAVPGSGEGQELWRKLVAATRVVPDTPDVRDLSTLLFRLARLARDRYASTPGGFDPAVHMSLYRDGASGTAEYVGVGVSTLDIPGTPWEHTLGRAEDVDDVGGRMYVLLADQTAILVDRPPPRRGRRDLGIHSTGNLNYRDALANRMWTGHHNVSTMPADAEVWELLYELHHVTIQQPQRPTL